MSTISAGTTSTTTLVATGDTAGTLVFKTNDTGSGGTTAVTISTAQVMTLANALPAGSGGTGLTSVGTSGYALVSNGTVWASSYVSPIPTIDAKTSGSSATWTIPAGVTKVRVTVVGGGGNGGNNGVDYGGGGGGGGYAVKILTGLTAGNTLTYTVGAANSTSQVASGTQTITTISATGGSNGGATAGGAGGTGSNGDINISGAQGGWGVVEAGFASFNGVGGNSMLGFGGACNISATGLVGQSYGGGASGSRNAAKSGAAGIVIFEY